MRRFPSLLASTIALAACSQPLKLAKDDSRTVLAQQSLAAPSPSAPGTFKVATLFYGSGSDRRRREFRDSVTYRTRSVDASPFVGMSPDAAKSRKKFWGFDSKSFPINGRVWYPVGDGPFPLVLIVHGNHDPEQFSDPGYGYLGELLASRGFILASVDENFLNGSLRGESDGRGWMLLQHLAAWRAFTDSAGKPLHGKVDMNNIALMGHSRGGEAVAIAAAFNRLQRSPDDATIPFHFGFAIKSLVAIAPVDGQYRPADQPTPLENVNYLVIHGSHDGDVSSFNGLRQWMRVRYPDGGPWFKSAIYMYRANHGQWNSVWGSTDAGRQSARFLDLRGLVSEDEQRQFGKLYIAGFLEATLKGKREYLPMFRDHRTVGGWLPKTMYVTRYADANTHMLATFDEDIDVTTGTVPGVRVLGDSLSMWKEAEVPMRWKGETFRNNAAWVGWNNRAAPASAADSAKRSDSVKAGPAVAESKPDTTRKRYPAGFAVTLTDSLRDAWHVGPSSAVLVSLTFTTDKPGPRKTMSDSARRVADSVKASAKPAKGAARPKASPKPKSPTTKPEPDTIPPDLSVELVDAEGHVSSLPLSRFGAVRRPLEVRVLRRAGRDSANFRALYDYVPQTYVMPLADFARAGGFDPARLRQIRLRFDRTPIGAVLVDDVGVTER